MAEHEYLLDVSQLEPPEPLQKALSALDELQAGQYIRLLHRRNPELLYPILEKRGYAFHTFRAKEPAFEVLIWKKTDQEADARCQALIKQAWDVKKKKAAAKDTPKLSFEQAPPISIPFRFFLMAPVFGFVAAMVLLFAGSESMDSRWSPEVVSAVHFMVLGFSTMTMIGAMMQILPVVIGTIIPKSRLVSNLVFGLYVPGVALLGSAFLFRKDVLFNSAAVFLGLGFSIFIIVVLHTLFASGVRTSASRAIKLAVISLAVTVAMGIMMVLVFGTHGGVTKHLFVTIHLGWGLVGWTGLLIIGVSFQVVPMFQITPQYPIWIRQWLPLSLVYLLVLWSLVTYFHQYLDGKNMIYYLSGLLILLLTGLYSINTLLLQRQRRRKIPDVTVSFWQLAMVSAVFGIVLTAVNIISPETGEHYSLELVIGIVVISGVMQSVINGMLYKIMPFLVWFHLQAKQTTPGVLPNMKEIIRDRKMWIQYWLHFGSIAGLAGAVFYPEQLFYPAVSIFAISMLLLWANMMMAIWTYQRAVQR
ncbi:MAG: DUF2249 domain-containing protein [Nitrosopumilus sp.]|nr:DUF2249 domain-containing protein [Nitrosopumilus sp.]